MNKKLMDIIDEKTRQFDEDCWDRLFDHFGVNELKEIDMAKIDEVMQYINSVNEQISRYECMAESHSKGE